MAKLSLADLARTVGEQLAEITGRPVSGVSAVRRTDDGWRLCLDVVEVERVPASTSLLATYEVEVDAEGRVLACERIRRFHRSAVDG